MDTSRRRLISQVMAGGAVVLGGSTLMGQEDSAEDRGGKGSDPQGAIRADIAAVRAATTKEIVALLENEELDVHALLTDLKARSRITVTNRDPRTVHVRVSKACGAGQDGYWEIPPGATEPWRRCVYNKVTLKASYDRSHDFDSMTHTMMVSTGCNAFEINGGRFQYNGPPSCL